MNTTDTKICKYCASEIPSKANTCPKCQKDLRNWFVRHYMITFFLVIIAIGQLWNFSAQQLAEESKIEQEQQEKQTQMWKMLNLDGSNKVLTSMIKEIMDNPESYKHVNTTYKEQSGEFIYETTYMDNWVEKNIKAKFDKNNNFIDFIN